MSGGTVVSHTPFSPGSRVSVSDTCDGTDLVGLYVMAASGQVQHIWVEPNQARELAFYLLDAADAAQGFVPNEPDYFDPNDL